jgi:hypothetical protein
VSALDQEGLVSDRQRLLELVAGRGVVHDAAADDAVALRDDREQSAADVLGLLVLGELGREDLVLLP